MRKISKNIIDFILLIINEVIIIGTSFLCYLITPYSSKGNSTFIPLIAGTVVLMLITIVVQLLIIKRKNILVNLTLIYGCLIMTSAVILTIILKIIAVINPESLLVKTGLKSVIFLFTYYVIILLISLFNNLKIKEKETLTKKDI